MKVVNQSVFNPLQRHALSWLKSRRHDTSGLVPHLSKKFDISRQAVHRQLANLTKSGFLEKQGVTRSTRYSLATLEVKSRDYLLKGLDEDFVWRDFCSPELLGLPENIRAIWQYGISEMINNAIDHSGGTSLQIHLECDALGFAVSIADDGEGIFNKIQRECGLSHPREAILELAKGKLTTDPENHSGEGIFFTSRMFDRFFIFSDGLTFYHDGGRIERPDYLFENSKIVGPGTVVSFEVDSSSSRTLRSIFDKYTVADDLTFSRTVVPVALAQYEGDKLISRSQAKRLYNRFEKFKIVVLDFKGVSEIGQPFADELFRVFVGAHPEITLSPINLSDAVNRMIEHVRRE